MVINCFKSNHFCIVLLKDRFINGRDVKIDQNQNVKLLYSSESNGYTILKFSRPIKLCDADDRTIEVRLFGQNIIIVLSIIILFFVCFRLAHLI